MKPTVPETGTIVRLDGENAVLLLQGGEACKGCGAGKIGLCRPGGHTRVLTVKNSAGARVGDTVVIGIDDAVRLKGYLLSYIIPCAALVLGTFGGHFIGEYLSFPLLDVLSGFSAFSLATISSLKRLKRLDRSSSLGIRKILGGVNGRVFASEEEREYTLYAESLDRAQ